MEIVQAALLEASFVSMQIDDPLDALDIAEHRELYKYDYINEEIIQKADEAARIREADEAGEVASGRGCDEVVITLFFTDDEDGCRQLTDAETLLESLNTALTADSAACDFNAGATASLPGIRYKASLTADDSEWLYKWQEHFRPTKVGERIVVKPGWEDYEPASGELVIEMDPGMAFGSGLHETTSMCVKALERYMPEGAKVLDVGTGTGILAMAAVLLGAGEALGVDIDEEAVRVATENIRKNDLAGSIEIMKGDLMAGVDYRPDVIVANLMADLVIMLSPAAASQIRPGGLYITSGILDIKEETVADAIRAAGFDIVEILHDGEWRAIVAVRQK